MQNAKSYLSVCAEASSSEARLKKTWSSDPKLPEFRLFASNWRQVASILSSSAWCSKLSTVTQTELNTHGSSPYEQKVGLWSHLFNWKLQNFHCVTKKLTLNLTFKFTFTLLKKKCNIRYYYYLYGHGYRIALHLVVTLLSHPWY